MRIILHEDRIKKWLECRDESVGIREGFEQIYFSTADSYTDWLLMPGKKCKSEFMQDIIQRWNQLLLAVYARTEPYQKDEVYLWHQLEQIAAELEKGGGEDLRYYLVSTPIPDAGDYTLWREEEITRIADAFQKERCLFLYGGSEKRTNAAAMEYARRYAGRYDTIVAADCEGGLQKTIVDDKKIQVANLKYKPTGKRSEQGWYFRNKLEILRQITDERTLMVLAGLNEKEDKRLQEVLGLGCHLLFTGRGWTEKGGLRLNGNSQNGYLKLI